MIANPSDADYLAQVRYLEMGGNTGVARPGLGRGAYCNC